MDTKTYTVHCPETFAKDRSNLASLMIVLYCFVGMASKQKLLFVFLCCLILTSVIVPPAEGQTSECIRGCNIFAEIIRPFCRTLPSPVDAVRCLSAVNSVLRSCIAICRSRAAAGGAGPVTTPSPWEGSESGRGKGYN